MGRLPKSRLLDLITSLLDEILQITEESGYSTTSLSQLIFWLKTMNLIEYDQIFLERLLARMFVHLQIFKYILSDCVSLEPLSEDNLQSRVLISNRISFSNKVKNETEMPDFFLDGEKSDLSYWLFIHDFDSIKKEYKVDLDEIGDDDDDVVGHWSKFLLINQLHLILNLDSKLSRTGVFNAINHLVEHIESKANLHDLWIEEYKDLFNL